MLTIKEAEEILKKEYHVDNFTYLVNDILLPDFSMDKHDVVFSNQLFESVTQLGFSSKCELTVFEVTLKAGTQNKRVGITQEMFRILRKQGICNAIVAFANADKRNYRISLLTSKYEFDGEKIVKILSNPRRYSYSLGYGTKTKTAYKFLIEKGKVANLDELISRFSVEVVNKQFYTEIATAFTELVGGERNGRTYEKLMNIYGVTDQNKYAEFGVRLIGRIMFCWFLREKKSESGSSLVPGDMLVLNNLGEKNYYHHVLEPLFFELLNTNQKRRKREFQTDYYAQVPYLNGGLFSPHEDDHYSYNAALQCGTYGLVTIPNEWFTRLYSVLGEYNFTVDENTAYDIELSIDPEMLGRIFENLLAEINPETGENAKKSTGSFYTPRDIVDYMVDSSLCEYLKTKTGIAEEKLRALISYSKEDDELAVFDPSEKKKLINALYTITVLDPACGSGAFPIGMLQKVVYMLQELDPDAGLWFDKATENAPLLLKREFEKKFNAGSLNYIRKLCVIQNSIFGIDIQPIAVEISRLRCFLSLIIEEKVDDSEENRGINPLPNLDFKFIIANSLMKLPDESLTDKSASPDQLSMFENQDHISQLKAVREEYFGANDSEEKIELKYRFTQIQNQMFDETLRNRKFASARYEALFHWKPFANESTDWFDPEWMFGINDGFDIVIANPPYVSVKGISTTDKDKFRNFWETARGRFNLFTLMFEMGQTLLKNDGCLIFIHPEGMFTNVEYQHIRKYLLKFTNIKSIVMFDNRVFEAAVDTSITCIKNGHALNHTFPVFQNIDEFKMSIKQDNITEEKAYLIPVAKRNDNSDVIQKMDASLLRIGDCLEIQQGIIYSGLPKEEVFSNTIKNDTYKKCLDGRDISRWYICWDLKQDNRYIEYTRKLHRPREERIFMADEKILLPRKSTKINCGYDNKQFYCLNTAYICLLNAYAIQEKINLKFILGVLNSKLMNYYYKNVYLGWQITIPALKSLPLTIDTTTSEKIVDVVNSILNNKGKDISAFEKQIDELVYELYGLTDEEIALVEESVK